LPLYNLNPKLQNQVILATTIKTIRFLS